MKKTKSPPILLADDIDSDTGNFKRSESVRNFVTNFARRLGSSVDIVHIEDFDLYPGDTAQYRPVVEAFYSTQKSKLGKIAKSLGAGSRSLFMSGDPVRSILTLSTKRPGYEMIALGTHGRTGIARLIVGSVAEEVIRNATVPVLILGPKAQKSQPTLPEDSSLKILVPTALTPNSERAERYAAVLANRLGAELVFCHSLLEALHPVMQTALSTPRNATQLNSFYADLKASAERSLKTKVAKVVKGGVKASFVLDDRSLSSSGSVLKAAKASGASLIVMGTHGRSMLSGAFFGRTARGVILESEVPVITVLSRRS